MTFEGEGRKSSPSVARLTCVRHQPNRRNDKAPDYGALSVQNMAEAQRFELRDLLQSAVFKSLKISFKNNMLKIQTFRYVTFPTRSQPT